VAIEVAGGIKILVDLIFRWPAGTGVLVRTVSNFFYRTCFPWKALIFKYFLQERAAGALANLAADDKCSLEVAMAGGIRALVTLARSCKVEGVLEQVTCTLCF
jgi:hypothetical protein